MASPEQQHRIWPARRGAHRRPHRVAPVVDRVRQLAAAGRATHRAAQRDSCGAHRRRRSPDAESARSGAARPRRRWPAASAHGAEPLLARAHHGSVSKEQRALIEDDLKTGRLRCVVATSSLELGIDMGAVDLVIQVESPPSVASGLQRVGRAGHQVGEISRGVLFPKHRADLIHCAVAVERMRGRRDRDPARAGQPARRARPADRRRRPRSSRWTPTSWFDDGPPQRTVRHAPPLRLRRDARPARRPLPLDEFAELRPRLVWDRDAGTITGRPGAQRLAVTSGGTIPDRGLFGVFLASAAKAGKPRRRARRGDGLRVPRRRRLRPRRDELADQGDHPRPRARPARAGPARPAAVLARRQRRAGPPSWAPRSARSPRELAGAGPSASSIERCHAMRARRLRHRQPVALIAEQREATGTVPPTRTFVVERFRDELGDWRVILHSPYGLRVHAPLGPRGRRAAAGALRHRRAADGLRRRHHRAPARHRGHAARRRAVRLRRRRDRPDRHRRGRRLGAVRRPVPRMRGAGPAAAAPPPRQAFPAVAAAPAGGAAARRRAQVPGLPDRARDRARVPAGRLRRAGADGAACSASRSASIRLVEVETPTAVAVRRIPAVRLCRRVHVRGRQPAGRAAGRGAVTRQHAARRAAGPRRTARAARPARHRTDRRAAAAPGRRPAGHATPRASPTCCGCSARSPKTSRRTGRRPRTSTAGSRGCTRPGAR